MRAAIGAVNNAVRTADGRLVGFNSDAPGFAAGVELALGRPLAGLEVVVAGAGGAAHAVVYACLAGGARRVTVANRTPAAAAALATRFEGVGDGTVEAVALADPAVARRLASADLAVNATTVGHGRPGADARRRTPARIPPRCSTSCTCRPRRRCSPPPGRVACARRTASEMLIAQAAIAFERWTGVGGMAGVMRAAVAPLLADTSARA